MTHIKSDVFQKKLANMAKAKQTVTGIKKADLQKATKDFQKAVAIRNKLSSIDEAEINNIQMEKNHLLNFALK